MKKKSLAPVLTVGLLVLTACSAHRSRDQDEKVRRVPAPVSMEENDVITPTKVTDHIQSWPEAPRSVANTLLTKYGPPAEMNKSSLVWYNTAPFKRSVVYREEVTHLFPQKHSDVLEQVINYRVPAGKVDDLYRFNGSVRIDRTKGEISSRCSKEEMNVLALNLADKISRGDMSIQEARREFNSSAALAETGTTNVYTTTLNFSMGGNTSDPDVVGPGMQAEEVRQVEEAQKVLE